MLKTVSNRRTKRRAVALPRLAQSIALAVFCSAALSSIRTNSAAELRSLDPQDILSKLDLSKPGLEQANQARLSGDRATTLAELLKFYRGKYPLAAPSSEADPSRYTTANHVVDHIFQWGPYEAADYGPEIDWEWDPRGDIEWVAAVYRFYWARPLADAYRATRDEKYVRAFVELTTDWIAKHPLEKRDRRHPVYTSWRGFPWLDIQTGIRADVICKAFPALVHGESFTPEFLGVLLASLYDHQVKTEKLPMGVIHNKAIFEQRGFINVAYTFAEFADSRRWMELALERTRENFLAQTTSDGVQREWSFGYNMGVLRDAVDIMRRMEASGVPIPEDYRDRVRKMYDYVFAIATPELAGPMFGDASRSATASKDRTRLSLYGTLVEATELLDDPKYAARAKLAVEDLPEQTSWSFPEAGIYVLRDRWGPEQIYFALHCSPKGISGHDQADNGTFELCVYGQWLMPDTGFYTYGHDPEGRRWHRQTAVHQTLTLDGRQSSIAGKHLLWKSTSQGDVICVENASYKGLNHRRTVWFVDRAFFVLLDEAIGDASGTLDLHFQFAPGDVEMDTAKHRAVTRLPRANVLVWADPAAPITMEEEEGWYAWKYGHRKPRKALRFRHSRSAPAAFLTVMYPFRGSRPPEVTARWSDTFQVGADRVECQVQVDERTWKIGRELSMGDAWCR
ncbi:MAG: alginate lyase family protein [Pirellulaceae bacterium]|nr:alginate lyase family protein [Pirellulaceae bacterium]